MPSRALPKAYQILLKTHRLTIFLTAHQSATVVKLKEEALSALTSPIISSSSAESHIPTAPGEDVDMSGEEEGGAEMPRVSSIEDFELCRAVKGRPNAVLSGSTSVSYEILDPSSPVKGLLSNWETLYVQFKDEEGNLLPVEVSQPSLVDEEDEEPRRAPPASDPPTAVGKGKRKALPE